MKKKAVFFSTVFFCWLSCQAATSGTGGAALNDAEKSLLDSIASSDMAQIELSKVVVAKSTSANVRDFAQKVIDDGTANYQNLTQLCVTKNYAVAPQLSGGHQSTMQKMQASQSNDAVDSIYIDAINADQQEMDGMLERLSGSSNDGDISRFALDTLAMVKKHEPMASALSANP
jgi:putative membrane protein